MDVQLALGVRLRDDAHFSNFHGARNHAAAERLKQLVMAGNVPVTVICGDQDTGKSHLLQAVCHELEGTDALCLNVQELLAQAPGVLDGLEHWQVLCLDDFDSIAGLPQWEEAFFHLFNRIMDAGHRLFVAMTSPPAQAAIALPDLKSRLALGVVIQLGRPQDEDRCMILIARAEQRGLVLSEEVAGFILRRASRSMGELLAILDRLDENSLRAQRRLTIPFVKSVMGW
ncbi:MAG: DnaA regulatory inactivator Hda [Marinobacter sp.]|nr:DnaA regulatory inactivator Hda [Marinobacter sp.]